MKKQRSAFTLVELVVVVMILGILAAVAAPRLLETSDTATENGAKHTLAVIRDAIERYAAQHGGDLPGEPSDLDGTNFQTQLKPYLRGDFPKCPLGNTNADIAIVAGTDRVVSGPQGWAYLAEEGDFYINHSGTDSSGSPGVAYSSY